MVVTTTAFVLGGGGTVVSAFGSAGTVSIVVGVSVVGARSAAVVSDGRGGSRQGV